MGGGPVVRAKYSRIRSRDEDDEVQLAIVVDLLGSRTEMRIGVVYRRAMARGVEWGKNKQKEGN